MAESGDKRHQRRPNGHQSEHHAGYDEISAHRQYPRRVSCGRCSTGAAYRVGQAVTVRAARNAPTRRSASPAWIGGKLLHPSGRARSSVANLLENLTFSCISRVPRAVPPARWRIMDTSRFRDYASIISRNRDDISFEKGIRTPRRRPQSPPGGPGTPSGRNRNDLARRYLRLSPATERRFARVGTVMMRCRGSCPRRDGTRCPPVLSPGWP